MHYNQLQLSESVLTQSASFDSSPDDKATRRMEEIIYFELLLKGVAVWRQWGQVTLSQAHSFLAKSIDIYTPQEV